MDHLVIYYAHSVLSSTSVTSGYKGLDPSEAPACGPDLNYLMQTLGPVDVLKHILQGTGECAQIQGSFLGMSLPTWTLALFILLGFFWFLTMIKKG